MGSIRRLGASQEYKGADFPYGEYLGNLLLCPEMGGTPVSPRNR